MATSLRNSFELPLPTFSFNPFPGTKIQASGSATEIAEPPRYALEQPVSYWIRRGNASLALAPTNSVLLDGERLYLPEESMHHYNKADIVRAAALYLLHPMNQALSSSTVTRRTFKCQSEYGLDGTRCDVIYFKRSSDDSEQSIGSYMYKFGVLGFKRRGIIVPSEFARTLMPDNIASNSVLTTDWLMRYAFDTNSQTKSAFRHNSLTLIKQAAAYATATNTRFVSVFDWDTLVLIYFSELDTSELDADTRRQNGVGDSCELTVITDKSEMRKALLGFISKAWHEKAV